MKILSKKTKQRITVLSAVAIATSMGVPALASDANLFNQSINCNLNAVAAATSTQAVGTRGYVAEHNNPKNEVIAKQTKYFPMSDPNNTRDWHLSETFSDEFNGNTLNSRWKDKTGWPGRFPSYFVAANDRIENGKLVLTSKWGKMVKDHDGFVVDKGQMTQGYEAASIISSQKTGYGYYEVKSRTAPISMTSSFWFIGKTKEIDVYEQIGRAKINHKPDAYPINTHDFANGWENDVPTPYVYHTGKDLTLDYHVYGLDWGPEWLKFYFDGELIHTIKNTKFHEPLSIRFDMETFKWNGYPNKQDFKYYKDPKTGENRFTGDFHIEYFRVWRTNSKQNEEQVKPGTTVGKAKESQAVKGTPKDITNGVIDPIWNNAKKISDFKLLAGGIEKLNAKMSAKTLWDDKYLYILADVEDRDVFMNNKEKHNGDCVDLYIDGGNEKNKNGYDANDITLKLMPNGTLEKNISGVQVSSKISKGKGYTVQVKIPWSTLKVTPAANKIIGFDVQLNEGHTKTGKREAFTTWNGNKELWKTMQSTGNLKLISNGSTGGNTGGNNGNTGGNNGNNSGKVNWFKDPSFNNGNLTNSQIKWDSTWFGENFTTGITKFPGTTNNVMLIHNNKSTDANPQGNKHFTINNLTPNTNYTIKFRAYTDGNANIGVNEDWLPNGVTKGQWKDYQINFKTGANQKEVNFRIWNKAKNVKTYIDDLNLMVTPQLQNYFKDPGFNNPTVTNSQFVWDAGSWNKDTFTSGLVKEGTNNMMQVKSTSKEGNLKLKLTGLKPNTKYTLTLDAKSTGNASVGINAHGGPDTFSSLTNNFKQHQITFTTGANSTTAMFIVWNKAGNVTTKIDNLKLMY